MGRNGSGAKRLWETDRNLPLPLPLPGDPPRVRWFFFFGWKNPWGAWKILNLTIYSIQLKILKYRDDFLIISLGFVFHICSLSCENIIELRALSATFYWWPDGLEKSSLRRGWFWASKNSAIIPPGLASFSWRWSGHHLIGKSQKDRTVLCHSTVLNNFLLVGRRILLVATLVYPSTSMTAIRRSSSQLTWMKPKTQRFCYQSMFLCRIITHWHRITRRTPLNGDLLTRVFDQFLNRSFKYPTIPQLSPSSSRSGNAVPRWLHRTQSANEQPGRQKMSPILLPPIPCWGYAHGTVISTQPGRRSYDSYDSYKHLRWMKLEAFVNPVKSRLGLQPTLGSWFIQGTKTFLTIPPILIWRSIGKLPIRKCPAISMNEDRFEWHQLNNSDWIWMLMGKFKTIG